MNTRRTITQTLTSEVAAVDVSNDYEVELTLLGTTVTMNADDAAVFADAIYDVIRDAQIMYNQDRTAVHPARPVDELSATDAIAANRAEIEREIADPIDYDRSQFQHNHAATQPCNPYKCPVRLAAIRMGGSLEDGL